MAKTIHKRVLGMDVEAHPIVFPSGAILIIAFVVLAVLFPGEALIRFKQVQSWISGHFSWLYIISMTGFLVFAIYLALSPFGGVRLGPDDSRPEFSRLSWFAMLFSAGMGIGMLFFGVSEPMSHYLHPATGDGETLEAAQKAMSTTLFHWGFQTWGLYSIVALSLAYFGFRRGLPLSFRSVFYPVIGNRIHGRLGDLIDIMAILATLFGLATSLGLGAKQVNAGLNFVFGGPPQSTSVQVVLIACITAMAVASLISGLHVGIKWLSNINMCIAAFLLLFLFVVGPTVYLLEATVQNTGSYIQDLVDRSFWTATYTGGSRDDWFSSWTLFYWGWWIAWSPFVGMFIARISKGRTIREFVSGVLLVPTAVAIIWMTGFGNTAIHQELYQTVSPNMSQNGLMHNYSPRPYPVQAQHDQYGLPMTEDRQWLAAPVGPGETMVLLDPNNVETNAQGRVYHTAFDNTPVTRKRGVLVSAASGKPYWPTEKNGFPPDGQYLAVTNNLTIGGYLDSPILSAGKSRTLDTQATAMFVMFQAYPLTWLTALLGTLSVILFFVTSSDSASLVADMIASGGSEDPSTGTRLFWASLEGVLAAVLLVAGGLVALQTGSITLGLPFCVIVIVMCGSLLHGLKREKAGLLPSVQQDHIEGRKPTSARAK